MGDDGGGMKVKVGGNQLIMSDTYCTVLHTFSQKRNDDIYMAFITDTFSLDPSSVNPSQLNLLQDFSPFLFLLIYLN